MKKIKLSNVCADYSLDSVFKEAQSKGASVAMTCSTCHYNLFTYCHFEDQEDPVVVRALEGNYDSKKIIHDKIQKLDFIKLDGDIPRGNVSDPKGNNEG